MITRAELTVTPAGKDPARTRKVYHSLTNTLVGFIIEDRGKGCGYKYRLRSRDHACKERFRTVKAAAVALGAKL